MTSPATSSPAPLAWEDPARRAAFGERAGAAFADLAAQTQTNRTANPNQD